VNPSPGRSTDHHVARVPTPTLQTIVQAIIEVEREAGPDHNRVNRIEKKANLRVVDTLASSYEESVEAGYPRSIGYVVKQLSIISSSRM
jgi:hypothetical protein